MTVFEIVTLNIARVLLFVWFIYSTYLAVLFFKSEKYLKVKEMDKEVRISKADLKHEYKMAVLQSKNKVSQECTETGLMYNNYHKNGGHKDYTQFMELIYRLDFTRIEKLDDNIMYSLENGSQFNWFTKEELSLAITAIDELVSWASNGVNNVEVLESAKVIENYLGVRK